MGRSPAADLGRLGRGFFMLAQEPVGRSHDVTNGCFDPGLLCRGLIDFRRGSIKSFSNRNILPPRSSLGIQRQEVKRKKIDRSACLGLGIPCLPLRLTRLQIPNGRCGDPAHKHDEHRSHEERLQVLAAKPRLSGDEEIEEKRLKKEKLLLKDRMEEIVRTHREGVPH